MEPTATTSETDAAEAQQNGAPPAAETFDVHRPIDGSVIRSVPVDSPERVAEVVARVRAAQPEWEALGFEGRYRWLGKLRDWIFDNADPLADVMQAETGKVRADAEMEAPFICDAINFWGERAADYLADETPVLAQPDVQGEAAADHLPAVSRGRRHQPLELPADPGVRRRDPRADGGRRGRDQAVRGDAAGRDGGRSRLEGDRGARRDRGRERHR